MLDYFAALERLKKGEPLIVAKDCKITRASVAREAGRDASAIKQSRPEFAELIEEINKAAAKKPAIKQWQEKYEAMKLSRDKFQLLYEQALARELMLIKKLRESERLHTEAKQN